MNKRHLHHIWTRFRPISYWYFLVATLVCGVIFVFAYRQNNLGLIKYRDAVFAADEANGDVEKALRQLREYVYAHMNTDLTPDESSIRPPIQLKYRYERLVQAEKDRVSKINENIYHEAQIECEKLFPAGQSGRGRIPCIEERVSQNGVKEQPIAKELYQFDFVSPVWSSDLAGWMLILTGLFSLIFITRFLLEIWVKNRMSANS